MLLMANTDFENWNSTSVDELMKILIYKHDIGLYSKYGKIVPISKPLYDYSDELMGQFIDWYKINKPDEYKPDQGVSRMLPVKLIEKVYKMNKKNKKLSLILKTFFPGHKINIKKKKIFRIPYIELQENLYERTMIFLMKHSFINIIVFVVVFLLVINICKLAIEKL